MHPEKRIVRAFRIIRREAAERYLLITLLSFSASVSLTRLYLSLTGYPQIGSGEIHVAHVLWGGLLLFAAALFPLILANRWAYTSGAVLAGLGVGLFIDEVGKFITQRNDYFYPPAAPIIYTFFLLTVLLLLRVRRMPDASPHGELHRALGDIRQMLERPLKTEHHAQLQSRLDTIAKTSITGNHADLARSLLRFVQAEKRPLAASPARPRWWARVQTSRLTHSAASEVSLRISLIIGLLAIGLLTLKNPAHVLLGPWLPPAAENLLGRVAGRHIEASAAPFWFGARIVLELTVGSLLVVSAGLLAAGRTRWGSALGYVALLLSLTTVNLLLFYFEQFSTIATTTIQFLLLLGVLYYRRRQTARAA